jgi:hypothetical protein
VKADDKTEFLCAALALFKQFLYFAAEVAEWITPEEAQEILLWYWRLVLPESAPPSPASPEGIVHNSGAAFSYDDPDVFYRFLTSWFLPTYRNQIAAPGQAVTSSMVGKLHELGEEVYFITPRTDFLQAYCKWIIDQGASPFDRSERHWKQPFSGA